MVFQQVSSISSFRIIRTCTGVLKTDQITNSVEVFLWCSLVAPADDRRLLDRTLAACKSHHHSSYHLILLLRSWCHQICNTKILEVKAYCNYIFMTSCGTVLQCNLCFTSGVHKFSKILGARQMTWSKFHAEDPQILGTTIQIFVTTVTWPPGLCTPVLLYFLLTFQICRIIKDFSVRLP
jgi:hypothetical protein